MIGLYLTVLITGTVIFCIIYNLLFWRNQNKITNQHYLKVRRIILVFFGIQFSIYILCVVGDPETNNFIFRNIFAGGILHYLLMVATFRSTIL